MINRRNWLQGLGAVPLLVTEPNYQQATKAKGKASKTTTAHWYLDWNKGTDTDDGLSDSSALKTVSEVTKRIQLMSNVSNNNEVHVLTDNPEEDIFINPTLLAEGYISFIGEPTELHTGVFTSVINTDGVKQETLVTDSSISSWTANDLVWRVGRVIGGPRVGTQFVISHDMGGKTARVSQPHLSPFSRTVATLSAGDPYAIYTFPKFGRYVSVAIQGANGSCVAFQDLDMGMEGSHSVEVASGVVFADSCIINGFDIVGAIKETQLFNCAVSSGCRADYGGRLVLYGGVSTGCDSRSGSTLYLGNHIAQNNAIKASSNGCIIVPSNSWAAMFDTNFGCVINAFGRMEIQGRLWGRASSTGILVGSCGGVIFSPASPIAIQAPINAMIGGVSKTWAELNANGYINTANDAKIVRA